MFTVLVAAVIGAGGGGVLCLCVIFLCGLTSKAGFGLVLCIVLPSFCVNIVSSSLFVLVFLLVIKFTC